MNAIALFFFIGLLFFAAEIILPGGILGVLGGLAMLGGCVIAFVKYGVQNGLIATATAFALVGISLYIEFKIIPKTKFGQRLFLKASITDAAQAVDPAAAKILIGKTAEALTPLNPSGYILIDGRQHDAFSRSGSIAKGASVKVIGADNFRLIVTAA